jgi:uncharacterized protein DUF6686
MCSSKLIAHKQLGHVIQCSGCNHYQLAWGTTAIYLTKTEFEKLCRQISELKIVTVPNGFPEQKRVRIHLPADNVLMVLNDHELNQLYALLEEAVVYGSIKEMLKNNNLSGL